MTEQNPDLLALREGLRGPWRHDPAEGYGYKPRVYSADRLICEVGNVQEELWEEWELDAMRIAAIPSMLERIEFLEGYTEGQDEAVTHLAGELGARDAEIDRLRALITEMREALAEFDALATLHVPVGLEELWKIAQAKTRAILAKTETP